MVTRGRAGRADLALHGLGSNARYWSRVAAALPHRRIVALDQRGHGRSDRPSTGYAYAELVADVRALIEDRGLARPLVAGHSWGAAVALEVAAALGDDANGLAFIDGPAWPLSERFPWETFAARAQPPFPRFADLAEAVRDARGWIGNAFADDLLPFVEAGVVSDGDALVPALTAGTRLEILRNFYAQRQDRAWPLVKGPILVAVAERKSPDFLAYTRNAVERVGALVPRAVIRWYPTPHDIPLHDPAAVAADVEALG